jgi:Ca2+-binding EF-hand superfamily protein
MEALSDEQRSQISTLFSAVSSPTPTNSSPTIGHKELGFVLRSFGVFATESEIRDMISEVDTTGSGRMAEGEFANLMARSIAAEAEP